MNPNDFALLAIIAVMVGLYLMPITRNIILKGLIGVGLASIVSAIFLTGSRGGLLTLAVVSGIYIWNHPKRVQLLIMVIILLLVTFPLWPESVTARIGLEESEVSSVVTEAAEFSTRRRLSYILFSSELISREPLSGIGYRTFQFFFSRSEFVQFENPLEDKGFERLPHNAYLEIGVGTGLVGLFVYLTYLIVTGRDLVLSSRKTERRTIGWSVSNGFLLGLIAFVIGSLFLSVEHFNYLWLMGGIASALRHYLTFDPKQKALPGIRKALPQI
jgi:O-antigen ligase